MNRLDLINPLTDEQKAECDAHIARECERIQATWTEHERQCRSYTRIKVVTAPQVCADFADHVGGGRGGKMAWRRQSTENRRGSGKAGSD